MEETIVGFVPNVNVIEVMGQKEYSLLITTTRAIFALERSGMQGLGFLLGGVVGAALANAAARRGGFGRPVDPDLLAENPNSIAIPHTKVRALRTRKTLTRWELHIEYVNRLGQRKQFWGDVKPRPDFVKQQQKMGVKWKAIFQEYARASQAMYQQAWPELAGRA